MFFARRQAIRPQGMVCNNIGDAIIFLLPGTAAVKAVTAIVMQPYRRTFDSVPVVNSAVHGSTGFEKLPISMRPNDNVRITGRREHIQQAIHDDSGTHAILLIESQKIARIKEIPLSIPVLKRMSIDRKGLI